MKKDKIEILKTVLSCSVIVVLGAAAIVFGLLYMNLTNISFLERHKRLVETLFIIIIGLVTIISVVCQLSDKKFVYRLTFLTLILMTAALAVLYVMQITGLWDKIDSVEDLRNYVSGFGGYAVFIFIAIQFLQVVVLPIPGFITVSVGVLLFGAFKGSVYSVIGIVSASIVAFFIGRVFGYKVAGWLVGKENLDKGLELVKGKDKVILTFMFLFPFFPDDVLCFVAGLSSMSVPYYIVMITITRIINIVVSAYSVNGSIIPYNTWWGILLWIAVFILVAALCYAIYKHGDKIENFFKSKFSKRKNNYKKK
ncbi:MAG: TVP38/TMEM64 family protein [Clostridia bacterium]|nr:TVP38/TMEM64 family protein [Clostridia bacterium]